MNKGRTTDHKIEWSFPALNRFLSIQQDIDNLPISSMDRIDDSFPKGTTEDIEKLLGMIRAKVGRVRDRKTYHVSLFYANPTAGDTMSEELMFEQLEEGFNSVIDLYTKILGTMQRRW